MKRNILVLVAVLAALSTIAFAGGLYAIRNNTVVLNKDIDASGDTTISVAIPMTEEGTSIIPSKYTERPAYIVWQIYGKHLSRNADSTYRVTIRSVIDGLNYNITNPHIGADSIMQVAPWSATEQGRRGFLIVTPAISDTFSIRFVNPHPVLSVDSLTVKWRWLRLQG